MATVALLERGMSRLAELPKRKKKNKKRNTNAVRTYANSDRFVLRDLDKYALLTPAEEKSLFSRLNAGDDTALTILARHNSRLVVGIAMRYQGRGLSISDLVQEGYIGLIRGIRKFDPIKYPTGKLSTYCTYWITDEIRRACKNKGKLVKTKAPDQNSLAVHKAYSHSLLVDGYTLSSKELAELVNLPISEVAAHQPQADWMSLDHKQNDNSGEFETVGSKIYDPKAPNPPDVAEQEMDFDMVGEWLNQMPEEEAKFLRLRFGIGDGCMRTCAQLAEIYKCKVRVMYKREKTLLAKFALLVDKEKLNQDYSDSD